MSRSELPAAPPFLAPTKIQSSVIDQALIADGCSFVDARIERSVIGARARIGAGVQLNYSLILGADDYETASENHRQRDGWPAIGIGAGSRIDGAIVDKNARIGKNVRIFSAQGRKDEDSAHFFVRDGIVIIPKSAVIPDGTEI